MTILGLPSFRGTKPLSGLVLLALAMAMGGLLFFNWSWEGRFWKGWYTLLVPAVLADGNMESLLDRASDGKVIGEENSLLEYLDYGEWKRINPRELREKKGPHPLDPRLDPYMQENFSYFNQGIYKIFYLPHNHSPVKYFWLINRLNRGNTNTWILADLHVNLPASILFFLLITTLWFNFFPFCIPAFGLLSVAAFSILGGNPENLAVLALEALALRHVMDRRGKTYGGWLLFLLPPGAAYGLSYCTRGFFLASLTVGLMVVGSLLMAEDFTGKDVLKKVFFKGRGKHFKDLNHTLFEPHPLTPGPKPGNKNRMAVSFGGRFLLTALLLVASMEGKKHLPVDLPVPKASGLSWSLNSMSLTGDGNDFPSAADYVRHRAFQESFFYGGVYALPKEGEGISLNDYILEDGGIALHHQKVLEFSGQWFGNVMADFGESGIGSLILAENGVPRITRQSFLSFGIPLPMLLAAAGIAILNFLMGIPFLPGVSHPPRESSVSSIRRKKQAV